VLGAKTKSVAGDLAASVVSPGSRQARLTRGHGGRIQPSPSNGADVANRGLARSPREFGNWASDVFFAPSQR